MLTDRRTDGRTEGGTDGRTSSIHKPELLCNPAKNVYQTLTGYNFFPLLHKIDISSITVKELMPMLKLFKYPSKIMVLIKLWLRNNVPKIHVPPNKQ